MRYQTMAILDVKDIKFMIHEKYGVEQSDITVTTENGNTTYRFDRDISNLKPKPKPSDNADELWQ